MVKPDNKVAFILENEKIVPWWDFSDKDQATIVQSYMKALKLSTGKFESMQTIFNLVKPDIIMGSNETGSYCRIEPKKVEVVELLIKTYI